MKYILLLIVLLGCTPKSKDPIFRMGEDVTFKPQAFYEGACSGNGYIDGIFYQIDGSYQYFVVTPQEEKYCPKRVVIRETDIKRK